MARLNFDPHTLPAADRACYDAIVSRRQAHGAPFGGPYAALMNHPQLCERIETLGFFLKFEGRLPRDVYQFVVLAVARRVRSPFIWVSHAGPAAAAGIPAPVLATLQADATLAAAYPAPYASVLPVVCSALGWTDVAADVQAAASALFGVEGLVEIVALTGFYQMMAAVNQGFAVPIPDGVAVPF